MRPLLGLSLGTLLAACASSQAPARQRWSDLGFQAAAQRPVQAPRSELDRSTDALLAAIEATTGERPVFDGESFDLQSLSDASAPPPSATGWVTERRVVAMDILRDLERVRHDVAGLRRARAALRWDVALETDWTEVDARLVQGALAQADARLGGNGVPRDLPEVVAGEVFAWPVHPVHITSAFGARVDPFGEGIRRHAGLDLSGSIGQPVTCAAPGLVLYAGNRGAYGLHVEIRHRNGILTRYAHLSAVSVIPGERISAGAVLGSVGQSGRATGPHLHFEIWRDGLPVDPQAALPEAEETEFGTMPMATR